MTLHLIHPEDKKIYCNSIFEKRLNFVKSLKPEERPHYCFQHNIRLKNHHKQLFTMLQEYRVIKADAQGNPLVIMGYATDISYFKSDTRITSSIILRKPGEPPVPIEVEQFYPRPEEQNLTTKELEVLKWIIEGCSSREIAEKMYISPHTVVTHRKHMHEKVNAKNIADLLRYAINNHLV